MKTLLFLICLLTASLCKASTSDSLKIDSLETVIIKQQWDMWLLKFEILELKLEQKQIIADCKKKRKN